MTYAFTEPIELDVRASEKPSERDESEAPKDDVMTESESVQDGGGRQGQKRGENLNVTRWVCPTSQILVLSGARET